MTFYGLNILLEQLPIIFGVILFGALMKFNPYGRRFVVQHNSGSPSHATIAPASEKEEKVKSYLHDQLVMHGIKVGKEALSQLRPRAFHSLGLLEAAVASDYLTRFEKRPVRLSLLLNSNPLQAQKLLTENTKVSGLLLAYLLDAKLDMIVVE